MSESTTETHQCIHCEQVKPVSDFYWRSDTGKVKNTCKVCNRSRCKDYAKNGPQKAGRYRKFDQADGRRKCRVCGLVKELDQFQLRDPRKDARRNECVPCTREASLARYHADPEPHRDRMRRYNYGLPLGEYDRMHADQGGLCAICSEPETSLHKSGKPRGLFVDHDHVTGTVRGLLCMRCNIGIGQFREDIGLMSVAIEYIQKHSG